MREKIQRTLGPLVPTWDTDALTRRSTRGDLHLPHPERPLSELTRAAVLVPLVEREHGLHVLLTQRAAHLKDHAGQISFPGGRAETIDAHPVATALRETDEEVGIKEESISIAGCLDNYETGTGYLIVPVVGFVAPDYALKVDSFEVAEVFEVPLSF
ncbi:MAG: 8-oxo-dGTP pyrophosphatase MutT (NUDIX family), partial [Gammaproteobacteria bacterium]